MVKNSVIKGEILVMSKNDVVLEKKKETMNYLPLFLACQGVTILLLCLTIFLMQDRFNALSGVALLVAASQVVLFFAVLSQLKQ